MDEAIWLDFKRNCMPNARAGTLPDDRVMAAELRSELVLFQAGGGRGVQRVAVVASEFAKRVRRKPN